MNDLSAVCFAVITWKFIFLKSTCKWSTEKEWHNKKETQLVQKSTIGITSNSNKLLECIFLP